MKKVARVFMLSLVLSGCSLTGNTQINTTGNVQINNSTGDTTKLGAVEAASASRNTLSVITLSSDHKNILVDGVIGLPIDNDAIRSFFQTESQLCDGYNINSNPGRQAFCQDKPTFQSMSRFASIVVSPDTLTVGFTIETDTLTPDRVIGVFYPAQSTNQVHFLSNYYLGNTFISFSPNSQYLVYKSSCREAMCGLVVKDSATLTQQLSLNNPQMIDTRAEDIIFLAWITNNEIQYQLGSTVLQASF